VRVGLIGAGKFGSMFLSQVPTTQGMNATVIADLDVPAARNACIGVGWDGVVIDTDDPTVRLRREMEAMFVN